MKWVKTLFWMLIVFFTIYLYLQNQDKVSFRFSLYPLENYRWETPEAPLILVILCSILFGVLVEGIGDFHRRFLLKKALHQHQKTIERLEKEIQSLRSLGQDQASFRNKNL